MNTKKKKNNIIREYLRKVTSESFIGTEEKPLKINEWKSFLDSLPKDKDPWTISKNKYKCRMHYFNKRYAFIVNAIAMFELAGIHIKNLFNKLFNKAFIEDYIASDKEDFDMIILRREEFGVDDVFPQDLYKEFPKHKLIEARYDRTIIYNKELKASYKKMAKRNPFSFYYKLQGLRELALHSYVLENYNPKATVVYINERNMYGALLRDVYEKKNKEFIGFMHGTDLWHLTKAYMSFTRYYLWDNDYIEMYENDMNCNILKYIQYKPIKNSYVFEEKDKYEKDITYFMSGQTIGAQKIIAKLIEKLNKKRISLTIRPHPRIDVGKGIFQNKNLEAPNVDIYESINNSEYILGVSTTVIEQAYYGGKKILIDDMSNKKVFNDLTTRKYLMLKKLDEKNVELFSTYLKRNGINTEDLEDVNTTNNLNRKQGENDE